jgi:amidase
MGSAVEAVNACLERIEQREPVVRAWAYFDADHARLQAVARDREPASSSLHGVPVGVKDIIDTADMPTEYGSVIYSDRRPSEDAQCVAALRRAGAVILGKTVTTEFATWNPPATRNPHDLARTPGGSSSGTAAAVADDMVPLGLGTQTVGSGIRPASFCGVYCLKPTFGTIDLTGTRQLSAQFDTLALFARSADDLRLLLGAYREPRISQLEDLRFGFLPTPWWDRADVDCRIAITHAAEVACAEEREATVGFEGLVSAQALLAERDIAHGLGHVYEMAAECLSQSLRKMIEQGRKIDSSDYETARELRARCRANLPELFGDCHALITPAVIGEPPTPETTGDALFCRPWMMLGTPTLNVPGLTGKSGLPIGVQLVGRPGADWELLEAGQLLGELLAQ